VLFISIRTARTNTAISPSLYLSRSLSLWTISRQDASGFTVPTCDSCCGSIGLLHGLAPTISPSAVWSWPIAPFLRTVLASRLTQSERKRPPREACVEQTQSRASLQDLDHAVYYLSEVLQHIIRSNPPTAPTKPQGKLYAEESAPPFSLSLSAAGGSVSLSTREA
jgi:hypothetical protein